MYKTTAERLDQLNTDLSERGEHEPKIKTIEKAITLYANNYCHKEELVTDMSISEIKELLAEAINSTMHNGWKHEEKIIVHGHSYYIKLFDAKLLIDNELDKYYDRVLTSKTKRLTRFINRKRISKTYIAQKLKVSPAYLTMILQGKRTPKNLNEILAKINGILNSQFSKN